MKRRLGLLAVTLFSFCAIATELPVPEELIGKQTVGILHVNLKGLKYEQLVKTLTEKVGALPDPTALEPLKVFLEKFKAAGGEDLSLVINADKKTDAANADEGVAIVVNKTDEGDAEKLKALFAEQGAPPDKIAAECPKKVGDALVWYSPKFKMPKADKDKAASFTAIYEHMAKDSTVSIVIVPDEDAGALAEAAVKEAKPEEKAVVKALLGAEGFCVFTNLGGAAEPSLKVQITAEDADGAGTINKAVAAVFAEIKKEMPPPVQAFIDTLKLVQKEASVTLAIDLGETSKLIKAFAEPPPAK